MRVGPAEPGPRTEADEPEPDEPDVFSVVADLGVRPVERPSAAPTTPDAAPRGRPTDA